MQEQGISPNSAREQLVKWQAAQEDLQAMIKGAGTVISKRVRPIWRCAVCGRAGMPWVVC